MVVRYMLIKMRDAIYVDLKTRMDFRGTQTQHFAPIFCLYAAETFRREHAEGSWT